MKKLTIGLYLLLLGSITATAFAMQLPAAAILLYLVCGRRSVCADWFE